MDLRKNILYPWLREIYPSVIPCEELFMKEHVLQCAEDMIEDFIVSRSVVQTQWQGVALACLYLSAQVLDADELHPYVFVFCPMDCSIALKKDAEHCSENGTHKKDCSDADNINATCERSPDPVHRNATLADCSNTYTGAEMLQFYLDLIEHGYFYRVAGKLRKLPQYDNFAQECNALDKNDLFFFAELHGLNLPPPVLVEEVARNRLIEQMKELNSSLSHNQWLDDRYF